jgi:hypothetical protein
MYLPAETRFTANACVTSYTGGSGACDPDFFNATVLSYPAYGSACETLSSTSVWRESSYQYDYPWLYVIIPPVVGGYAGSLNGYNVTYE